MPRSVRSLLLGLALCALVASAVAAAPSRQLADPDPIEGRWEVLDSNNKVIGVFEFVATGEGTFTSKVISPRKFPLCDGGFAKDQDGQIRLNRVGKPQPDGGEYRGTWNLFSNPECEPLPELGAAVVRVGPTGGTLVQVNIAAFALRRVEIRTTRIGKLELTFLDRVDKLGARLRRERDRLIARKNAVELTLEKALERAGPVLERKAEIEEALREVDRQRVQTRELLAQVDKVIRGIRDERLQGLLRQRALLDGQIAQLEEKVFQALEAGRDPSTFRAELRNADRASEQLEEDISRALPGKLAADRKRWLAAMRALEKNLERLRAARLQVEQERLEADGAVQEALRQRAGIDAQLLDLIEQIAASNIGLSSITVSADGQVVFRAEGSTEMLKSLADLDARIDEAQAIVSLLERRRDQAKLDFLNAERQLVAAEARLADAIWALGLARTAVDVAYLAVDLGVATAKGGVFGFASEGVKKAAEILVFDVALKPKFAPDEGTVEAELNARYKTSFKETIDGGQVGYVAGGRLLKETVGKAGKDTLNARIAEGLARTGYNGRLANAGADLERARDAFRVAPNQAQLERLRKAATKVESVRTQIQELSKGFDLRKGLTKPNLSKFVPNRAKLLEIAAKDLGKTAAKKMLDLMEREVYVDFFEKDVVARSLYPLFRLTSSLYWEAHDTLTALLEQKGKVLLSGFDQSGLRRKLSKPFPRHASLQIVLAVETVRGAGAPPELDVFIGGAKATAAPRSVFNIGGFAGELADDGTLSLEVR